MSKFENRLFRCGESNFHGDEILLVNQTHTIDRIKAIADAGFNGIWLNARLKQIVPTKLFAEFEEKADERLNQLRKFCASANSLGLGVWINFHEPLGMYHTDEFWKKHPDLKGHPTTIYQDPTAFALCSSMPQVQQFLYDGFSSLFSNVHLAGVTLITASEWVNNCWAHVVANPQKPEWVEDFFDCRCLCPRCAPRGPVEVVSEIITIIRDGIKCSRPSAEVVAWDWSWNLYSKAPYMDLIAALPKDVVIMGDFERGGYVKRDNEKRVVEEYSLIYPGPSGRFRKEVSLCKAEPQRKIWAKLQINTSHEMATIANLPLMVSLYRKFKYLHRNNINGYMGTVHFGCSVDTLNVFATNKLSSSPLCDDEKQWLLDLALDYFGIGTDAEGAVRAWYSFMRASYNYPIGGNNCFLYFSPVNEALSYPLVLNFEGIPMGGSWRKHGFCDRLEDTAITYSIPQIVKLFDRLSNGWSYAVEIYESALNSSRNSERAEKEIGVAKIASASFTSTRNIYKWYMLRKNNSAKKLTATEMEIVENELSNLKAVLPYVEADSRCGFHEEAQWRMFDPESLNKKIELLSGYLK